MFIRRETLPALRTLRTIKIKFVYHNRSFPQNLNHWLFKKSEMINRQMLIQKNTFNVLSLSCPFEKTYSAMSASVSLARTPFLAHAKV